MNAIVALTLVTLALGISTAEEKLEFVTFVHRHGDRSPASTYPTDPYATYPWKNGFGELTNTGKQNAYKLGQWLRARYGSFLPKIYQTIDYHAQSTDMSRTLMSGYLVLAGLYEPTDSDVWNPRISWQPIPVHTIPRVLDNVLAAAKPCPKHARLLAKLLVSKEVRDLLEPYTQNLTDIALHAGYNASSNVMNLLSAAVVYDATKVQQEHGLEIPKWTEEFFPQPLADLSNLALRFQTYNRALQRLSCGLLVQEILRHFKLKADGCFDRKMWHYSGHDTTIVGLRDCLGFRLTDSPPYTSALILELVSNSGKYFVRILYKTDEGLQTLTMPGCTEPCPLEKFEELVRPIIPEDWDAECRA